MNNKFYILIFILMMVMSAGCAKHAVYEKSSPVGAAQTAVEAEPAPVSEAPAEKSAPPESQASRAATPHKPAKRMVHYHGHAQLQAADPEAVLEKGSGIVRDAGGYIVYMDPKYAVLHVPVDLFHATFERLLTLGRVLDKSISAEDITDSYHDAGLRLQVAEATRKRLLDLLAKAKTDKERLSLLKEIQRINEQIEHLIAQRKTLAKLAGFSRITLDVLARQQKASAKPHDDIPAFRWIYDLSPFEPNVARSGKKVRFAPPDQMVALDKKDYWSAESADGVVFWASRHKNKPSGDASFWVAAIRERLGKELSADPTVDVGNYKILRLVSKAKEPYVYLIGTRTVKLKRYLVEAFFPSLELEAKYKSVVFESIKKGAKK